MGWITSSLRGDEDLWKVFWVYGLGFMLLARVVVIVLRLTTSINYEEPTSAQLMQLTVAIVIYLLWWLASLWQCSYNVQSELWTYVTRTCILVVLITWASLYLIYGSNQNVVKFLNDFSHILQKWFQDTVMNKNPASK